jgi:hypothetical protein
MRIHQFRELEDAGRNARRAMHVCIVVAVLGLLGLCLTSCTVAYSPTHGGFVALGSKSEGVKVNKDAGIEIAKNDNVEGFQKTADVAQKAALYRAAVPLLRDGVKTLGDLGSDALKLAE